MGAIVFLLVLGICVFLIWFFESVMKDVSMDDAEVYIDLRLERAHRSPAHRNPAQGRRREQAVIMRAVQPDPMRRAG